MHGLKGGSRWTVHLVIIVGGMCASVHTQAFNKKMHLKLPGVIESKWDEVSRQHVFKLIDEQEHERVSSLRRREETKVGGQQVAAERQSISEEM